MKKRTASPHVLTIKTTEPSRVNRPFSISTMHHSTQQRKLMTHFIQLAIVVGTLSALIIGCGEEPVATDPVPRPVKIMVIEENTAGLTLEYPGKISPNQESYMAFEVPGRIVSFPVNEGQSVKKGAILARLDPRDYQATYDAEIARLRQASAEYERYAALYEAQNTSLSELQIKQRSFEVRKATVRQAKKALQDTQLIAPFSGKIGKKLLKDFQNVQAKEPVLILQDNSTLEILINIPERDLTGAVPGFTAEQANSQLTAMFSLSSIPGRIYPARIKEFASTADPETRTFEITLGFDPPGNVTLLPGMTTKVMLQNRTNSKEPQFFRIPVNAVAADDTGESFVWLIDPTSMQIRRGPVKLGEFSESMVDVHHGLSSGDWVAISGVHQLREDMTVRQLEEPPR
jgi:RND family efflux transporter MFP subunit